MADKSSDGKSTDLDSSKSVKTKEYDVSSGKSPLEWLEINEGIRYSQLERISGERKILRKFAENPVVTFGLIGSLVAIGGGLYSVRSDNPRMSNNFLKLRWATSSLVFGYIVFKIWDQIDWNPPGVKKLHDYITLAFKKDLGLISQDEAAKVKASIDKLK